MSWVAEVWTARSNGLLNAEEAWQVLLAAREAPDPSGIVKVVLHGLAWAPRAKHTVPGHQLMPYPFADPDVIVIEDD